MIESLQSTERSQLLLEGKSVTKSFGALVAVHNVSLCVKEGMILGLIGPNGAGKTTIINLISGIHTPDRGTISFMGKTMNRLRPDEITKLGVSRTYQLTQIFDKLTVLENVRVGCYTHFKWGFVGSLLGLPKARDEENQMKERALKWLSFVGLEAKALHLSTSLSLGERKLLELARALANEPKLLLVDEPTAGLSASEKGQVRELIQQMRDNGIGVLLVEHDVEFVMGLCNPIVVLNYGEMIAEGPPEAIRKDQKVIDAYLGVED